MEAFGVAQVPGKRLGLRPRDKSRAVLKLTWIRGRAPESPPTADRFNGWEVKLLGNDQWGNCGPVSVANHRAMDTTVLTGLTDYSTLPEVHDLYRRSGNPDFDPNTGRGDRGVTMPELLHASYTGGIGGDKLIGYASLADLSDPSLYAAINLFGGVLFAVDLQTAQSGQTDRGYWDYSPSRQWGGHAIIAASYDQRTARIDVGTWGKRIYTTARFRQHQLSEVWVPLWPELVTSGKLFDSGVDWQSLVASWQALTGRPFPVPVPIPVPVPPPTPPPTGGEEFCLYPETRTFRAPPGWSPVPG